MGKLGKKSHKIKPLTKKSPKKYQNTTPIKRHTQEEGRRERTIHKRPRQKTILKHSHKNIHVTNREEEERTIDQ